jgi:hypothetical protein
VSTIAVDGLSEEDFRRAIENRLRDGQPALALERLRKLLDRYCGPGRILPERFMTVRSRDLLLTGWQVLEPAIRRHDRPGKPVTALSIAFGWPGEDLPRPDDNGNLRPHIETAYFCDDAFPFSQSAREDLLDGYSIHGCTWAADCIAADNALSLEGIDDLCGALALLEARLLASDAPDEEEIRAGSLGACLLSALLYQAVSERIERDGLPRPLCIMAGSNGVYPYFDAPVAGFPEEARKAAEGEEDAPDQAVPGPRYSSLLMTGVPRGRKRAVLVLDETESETAGRIASLRGLQHMRSEAAPPSPEPLFPAAGSPAIGASPLLTKKPGDRSWDFRDLLGPRDTEPPEPPAATADDWDDWDMPTDAAGPAESDSETVDGTAEPLENRARAPGLVEWPGSPELPEAPSDFAPACAPDPVEPPVEGDPRDLLAPEPEPPLAESPPGHADFAPLDRSEPPPAPRVSVAFGAPLPEPGFALLPLAESESLPLPRFNLATQESGWAEPEPTAKACPDIPNWPFGLDWLAFAEPVAPAPAPAERPGLWARLRSWIRL